MAELPPELVEELYAAPVGEFIARRDARAKELRKGGDRAGADAVKKLRKPSVSAAAVNRLARESSEDVSALLAAGEALRQAQLGGGDREAIRSAASDERAAVDRLVGAAGRLSAAVADEVRGTLHAAASDAETRDLVSRGVLTEARQPLAFGFAPAEGSGPAKGRVDKGGRAGAAREDAEAEAERAAAEERERAEAERAAEAERKRAAKERVKAAKAALREAEKDAKAAERERDRAAKALDTAEQAVEAARAELEAAESA